MKKTTTSNAQRPTSNVQRKARRIAWAIITDFGFPYALNSLRREAIAEQINGTGHTWRWWKRRANLRAVKVEVREL